MLRQVLIVRVLPVVLTISACVTLLSAVDWSDAAAAGSGRLPDLDQETPSELTITRTGSVWVLGFRSAVRNVGDGALVIDAHRPTPGTDTMTADQLIERDGSPAELVSGVGRLRYVVSPDHRHWHLLGFDRYSLRRAGSSVAAVRDRKSGFCLGDRYRIDRRLPAAPAEPRYTSRCGLAAPGLFGLQEGISVGYGDDYPAYLEGQYLRLSGLRGRPLRARAPGEQRPAATRARLRQQRGVAAAPAALARGRADGADPQEVSRQRPLQSADKLGRLKLCRRSGRWVVVRRASRGHRPRDDP